MSDREHLCWCGRTFLARVELPQRRGGENFDFLCGTTHFTSSVRRAAPRSRITEVFINSSKVDSDVDLTMRDAACVISIALQYGVPLGPLAHSTGRNADGAPASPIGAILDILLREEGNGGEHG
jgi:hypothetical protein